MKIAIVGAGYGGMAAAFDLVKAGHQVTIFEGSEIVGGLAAGIREPGWDWSLEKFYHHFFQTDADLLGLANELGLSDEVIFVRPKTVVHHEGDFYPLDSPLTALTFPGFNLLDIARFGFVTVYLRYLASWKAMEKHKADTWLRKAYGNKLYDTMFEPLLVGKFGPHYKEVNMAWFWARFKARSTKLGTFKGGFQHFAETLADHLRKMGVDIRLKTPISQIKPAENGLTLVLPEGEESYDQCLVTVAPGLLARMAPDLPENYLKGLLSLKSMGAVVMILALKHQLSTKGYYWFNLPKSAGYPFLALVEHTNFMDKAHYGGENLVYCGDYLDPSHEYFKLSKEELLERFLPALKRINPAFEADWVRQSWLFKTNYAQPVPLVNHSGNIPAIQTPLPGLYFASMSQVYPWDRGTNFVVQIGRKAAKEMLGRA